MRGKLSCYSAVFVIEGKSLNVFMCDEETDDSCKEEKD